MLACLLSLLLLSSPASALELAGKNVPETVTVSGKTLKLNGAGLRIATMFKVKAYVGALYAEKTSKNADELLASKQIRRVDLHFLRDVDAGKMRGAWEDSLENNCPEEKEGCGALKPKFETLKGWMSDVKENDVMSFTFHPDKVEVAVKGQKKGEIAGADFSRTMLATWLGPEPPNDELKEGMLGGSGR